MANLMLIIGHVKPEHITETDFKIFERHGSVIEGVRRVWSEHYDPQVYLAKQGLWVEGSSLKDLKAQMRANIIGSDQDGAPHKVIAIIWGTDTKQKPGDFSWAFDEDSILMHSVARIGDDNSPWIEYSSCASSSN